MPNQNELAGYFFEFSQFCNHLIVREMLGTRGLLAYRFLCLFGYAFSVYCAFEIRPENVTFHKSVIIRTRFLTIDTLVCSIILMFS